MSKNERTQESRSRLYAAIERAAAAFPNSRVAQILVNAASAVDIYHFEDDELTKFVNSYVDLHSMKGKTTHAR